MVLPPAIQNCRLIPNLLRHLLPRQSPMQPLRIHFSVQGKGIELAYCSAVNDHSRVGLASLGLGRDRRQRIRVAHNGKLTDRRPPYASEFETDALGGASVKGQTRCFPVFA